MKLSIICINYFSEDYILRLLHELSHKAPIFSYEILIGDNGSIRKSFKEKVQNFPKVKYIKFEKNLGFGRANNRLVKIANGDYILLINPDICNISENFWDALGYLSKNIWIVAPKILLPSGIIEKSVSEVQTPIRAIIYFTPIEKLLIKARIHCKKFWMSDNQKKITVGFATAACIFMKKRSFQYLGGFDERLFMYYEDTDLCFQCLKHNKEILFIPEIIVNHSKHGSGHISEKHRSSLFKKSRLYYFKKNFGALAGYFTELILRSSEIISSLWSSHLRTPPHSTNTNPSRSGTVGQT